MNDTTSIEARISQYLAEVESHLSALSEGERADILNSLQAHIDNELQNRNRGQPTQEDVDAILMDMDPPESYAESISFLAEDEIPEKRVSRLSITGAITLPFGFLLVLLFIPLRASTSLTQPTIWQNILSYILLPISVIAPFATTALGLLGISEIRNSKGKIYGLPLAVFVSLFYPIIVLTLILFMVGWSLLGEVEGGNNIPLVWLFIVLVIDYLIIRFSWRAASKK